jgi:hypothetical protein
MRDEQRVNGPDRRAHRRSGRREYDSPKPWYVRRRWWLAAVSAVVIGWKRVRRLV